MRRCPDITASRRRPALLAAALLLPVAASAAPGDVLFSDGFEDGSLLPWTTTNPFVTGVSNAAGYAGSGAFGAYTSNTAVAVTSPSFSAAVPAARLDLWIRRGADAFSEDTDAGEDLVLEYRRSDASWAVLNVYDGGGTNGQVYNDSYLLPPDARHAAAAIRLRQTGGSGFGYDFWHFDDVVVTETAPAPPLAVGSCDDFENGLGSNWTISAAGGFAGVSGATFQSPVSSMFLNGGIVEVAGNVVDTGSPLFGELTVWVRRGRDTFSEDPDGGEDLVIEYLDDGGSWAALETFTGNGGPGQVYSRSYDLPAAGRHAGFRLRFRMTGGSGPGFDFWHVDDVCYGLGTEPVLSVSKVAQVLSDPVNGSSNAKAIPGATMEYTVGVTNQGAGPVDGDSLVITDLVPAGTALFVDTGSGDPVTFADGPVASGLSYSFASDVRFSSQPGGGPPYTYVPVPDAGGFDPAVTGLRISPGGQLNAAVGGSNPSFNVRFRVRID